MRSRYLVLTLILCALLIAPATPAPAASTTTNVVGIVVQHGDGRVETRTVHFNEPSISGMEALQRSGLSLATSGNLICSINGTGCSGSDCFCGCPAPFDPCYYWSYFHWNGRDWDFSTVGAADHTLHNGDVDAYHWSDSEPPTKNAYLQLATTRALDWLRGQQNADGSFPGFGVGATVDAVIALAAANENTSTWRVSNGPSARDFLASNASAYATSAAATGKLIVAAVAADADPLNFGGQNLVEKLASFKNNGGRFGASNWDQAYALLGLRAAFMPVAATERAVLRNAQTASGGWGYMPTDAADVDSTGLVLQALVAAGEPITGTAVSNALAFLHTQQNSDAGFPYQAASPTNANSTAFATQGLLAGRENPLAASWAISGTTPIDALLARQSLEGGFAGYAGSNDFYATVAALPALVGKALPLRGRAVSTRVALTWLRTQQQANGSFGTLGQSVDAALAAASGGQDVATWANGGPSLLDFLTSQASTYTQSSVAAAGKLTVAALAARPFQAPVLGGFNVGGRVLQSFNHATGQFGTSVFDQTFGMLAASAQYAPGRWLAREQLRQRQLSNGGWEFGAGFGADTNTTALAIQALVAAGEPANSTTLQNALNFLRRQQNTDGGFPYQKSCSYPGCAETDANSTAFVVQALVAAGENPDGWAWSRNITETNQITLTVNTPVDALLTRQSDSGAFAGFSGPNDLYATLQAVPGVALRPWPVAWRATQFYPLARR